MNALSERAPVEGESGGGGGLKAKLAARFKKRSEDSPEKKKQLQDYTAWVNNYLRRKPGTPLVSDLRWNLGDGITFVHLVEIVAKAQVAGVQRWPTTAEGKRSNTERALEFLRADGVVLHQDACRDLIEGNVKGVMKVILAVAERYQPKSVKPRSVSAPEQPKPATHMTGPLPSPAVDPGLARQDPIRPYTHPQTTTRLEYGHCLSQPVPPSYHSANPSNHARYPLSHSDNARGHSYAHLAGQEEMYSSPIDQLPASIPPQIISSKKKTAGARIRAMSLGMQGIPEETNNEWEGLGGLGRAEEGDGAGGLAGEIGAVVTGLTEFKAELLQLHAVLLRNNDGVYDVGGAKVESLGAGGESSEDRLARERERERETEREREKLEGEVVALREQLGHMQDECTQVEAECAALRNMVEERNAFITTMKSEIYRKEYLNDTERTDLHTQLLHKDTLVKKLETDLEGCHGNLEAVDTELGTLQSEVERNRETAERNHTELEELRGELAKTMASEEKMSQRLSAREKKLQAAEDKLAEEKERATRRAQQLSEEVEALREGLGLLTADSAHSDQLEALHKTMLTMVDIATGLSADKAPPSSPGRRRKHRERDQEEHSRHRRKHRDRHGSSQTTEPHPPATPPSPDGTRILYYMLADKTETPYVAMVPRKLTEATLKDFKAVFGRHGDYRYFFKTEDPDCGVVKEELTNDDQKLPSWKGKVTAWIREPDASTAVAT